MINVEPYSSFSSVGSDHRIVTARLRLSLRTPKAPQPKQRYDWKLLRHDEELRSNFTIELRNKYDELFDESSDATTQYAALVQAKDHAAAETLPPIPKGKTGRYSNNPAVIVARKKVIQLTHRYAVNRSKIIKKRLQEAKGELEQQYKTLEQEHLLSLIEETEKEFKASNTARAWKVVNTITNRKTMPSGKLKGKSPEERKKQWLDHFRNLLGTPDSNPPVEDIPPIFSNLGIEDGAFTLSELREAKKQISFGKAPGEDGIMPELLKVVDIDDIILNISNNFYVEGKMPDQLGILNLIPLPKSGDLSKTGNYRGIALTSLIMKTINRMILNRLRPVVDPLLRGNQNGFRPGRSTVAQVFALRRVIEETLKNNLTAVLVFIDFKKAFDSINHETMFKILHAYGIPPKMLAAIKLCYQNLKAKVVSPDGDTDMFKIHAGVMQGDTLAPFLFVTVLDYALRKAICGRENELGLTINERRSRRVEAESISDLDFADDIVLMSNTVKQAQKLLLSVEEECKKVGLMLNSGKTKSMFLNIDAEELKNGTGDAILQALTESGDQDFLYLGSWCDKLRDMKTRKALAWRSLNKLDKIWKSNIDVNLKVLLFRATTETILLYGSQTWALTVAEEKHLNGTYTRMLRKVKNISWSDKVDNKTLYGKIKPICWTIKERRLRLAGHIQRDKSSPAHKTVLWQPKHGSASRGRPTTTLVDTLLRDTGQMSTAELNAMMMDRTVWSM